MSFMYYVVKNIHVAVYYFIISTTFTTNLWKKWYETKKTNHNNFRYGNHFTVDYFSNIMIYVMI